MSVHPAQPSAHVVLAAIRDVEGVMDPKIKMVYVCIWKGDGCKNSGEWRGGRQTKKIIYIYIIFYKYDYAIKSNFILKI